MWDASPRPLLGIMTSEFIGKPPFANSVTCRKWCLLGEKLGMETFVFSPGNIHWNHKTVTGYTYQETHKGWMKREYPLPSLVYDRCFFSTSEAYLAYRGHTKKLRSTPHVRFLGYGLAGKWDVQRILQQQADFHPYLPETERLKSAQDVLTWLGQKQEVFLKPQGGSHGKGALYIKAVREDASVYEASGRNGCNMSIRLQFSKASNLKAWLESFIGKRPYLIQEYLSLHNTSGTAFDIRSLVQKNENGHWQLTGMGIRCGQNGSITSNLHGGGTASELMPFLIQEFGDSKAEELKQTLIDLSALIPPTLEAAHGCLVELGIDFGIDRSGHIWILEVNSKPGRTLFTYLKDDKTHQKSLENPIRYAGFLLGHRECTGRDRRERVNPTRIGIEISHGQEI
jgi:glutathione synthase/RimK-type ligase-like ATP-grasp enzyme